MQETIFLNGKFIPEDKAQVSAQSPGFLYGFGVFETMRSCRGKIVYLSAHLDRLKISCKLINLPVRFSSVQLAQIIRRTVKINRLNDAYARLTAWKDHDKTGISVIARKYTPPSLQKYDHGFYACISVFRQNENNLLAQAKVTSRIFYELAYQEAKKNNFDEALILNGRGYLTEASRCNIFLVKAGEIFTPGLECGCLGGITRKVIFVLAKKKRLKISEGNFVPADLYSADEAFLTNSLIGVMPLTYVEKHPIADGKPGKMAKIFVQEYGELLK